MLRLDLAEDAIDLAGFDGVFHLAGQPGVRSFGDVFPLYVRNNVLASQRLFEAAVESGVRVVFSSSSSVYGAAERFPTPEDTVPEPISPYAITKLAAEHLARAYERSFGLDVVVLRYFNAFGPRQRPGHGLHAHRASRSPRAGRSTCTATARRRAAGRTSATSSRRRCWRWSAGEGLYNVGGGVEASMREAIAMLERISGRQLELREEPPVPGDQRRTRADTTRIRDELGWSSRASRSRTGCRLSGSGLRLESPRR